MYGICHWTNWKKWVDMTFPWETKRRFNAYPDYFKKMVGERVQKITIDAGFTCPNRDGTVGRGGCTFCDNRAFNPSYNQECTSVTEQIDRGIRFHRTRYRKATRYLAYFQAYSNTYAPLEELKRIYEPALEHPDIMGIVIGTRPDCVDSEKLDYFKSLASETYLTIEYGIESVFDRTLEIINRGHTMAVSKRAINETALRGIRTGGHLIIGLPGEEKEDWMESIKVVSRLPLDNIKFHQLQIVKGTVMAGQYQENPAWFREFTLEEYLDVMAGLLERLHPSIVVERIAGEVNPELNMRQGWGVRYDQVLRRFEEILEERDTWQGRLYMS